MQRCARSLALLAMLAPAACGDVAVDNEVGPGDEVEVGPGAPVLPGAYGAIDIELDGYLERYHRELDTFADDELRFDVNEGVVSVAGEVDTPAERDELVAWVDAVPGVRQVDAAGVTVP